MALARAERAKVRAAQAAAAAKEAEPLPDDAEGKGMDAPLIGKRVRKNFPGHGWHYGTVDGYCDERKVYHISFWDGDAEEYTISECQRHVACADGFKDIPMPSSLKVTDGEKGDGDKIEVKPVDKTPAVAVAAGVGDADGDDDGNGGYRDEIFKHRHLELWVNGKLEMESMEELEWVGKRGAYYIVDDDGESMRIPVSEQVRVLELLQKLCRWSGVKLIQRET